MSKTIVKPIAAVLGAAFLTTVTVAQAESVDANPFGMTKLDSGYMQLAEGKCGEGKCGEKKAETEEEKPAEGKCGEAKCGEKKD